MDNNKSNYGYAFLWKVEPYMGNDVEYSISRDREMRYEAPFTF